MKKVVDKENDTVTLIMTSAEHSFLIHILARYYVELDDTEAPVIRQFIFE